MKLKILVLFLISIIKVNCDEDPQVKVKQGILGGEILKSRLGRSFYSFTAIPYAKPPVGSLRFKPPVAINPWEDTLDATKKANVCPQTSLFALSDIVIGDEDCLYLNVYTPKLPKDEGDLLPVLLYIHGGAWLAGSGNPEYNGPKFLLDQDVVLVTINYRLGALGFFTTGDHHVLGNNGLKDQAMAIKWAKDNIIHFGGDPNKLTIFGQSAGAVSVHYHMVSPLTRDLINGAIAHSGSTLQFWASTPHFLSTRRSKSLAKALGCNPLDSDEMMKCLRKIDAQEVIKKEKMFIKWDIDPMMVFAPVVEPNIEGAFLAEDPIDTIKSGKAANVPFMIGLTTEEGALRAAEIFSQPNRVKELNDDYKNILPTILYYEDIAIVKHKEPSTVAIKKFYFGNKPIDDSTKMEFVKMYGDATMLIGIDAAVELHAKYSIKPTYYYLFGYRGSKTLATAFSGSSSYDYGVAHCDDLLYLFDSKAFFPDFQPTDSDNKMIDIMTALLANFATFGNPTPEGNEVLNTTWKPVERKQQNYLFIKEPTNIHLKVDVLKERRNFWRKLNINGRTQRIRDEL